jgi:hypothetical protein
MAKNPRKMKNGSNKRNQDRQPETQIQNNSDEELAVIGA